MLRRTLDYGLLAGGGLTLLVLLAGLMPVSAQAPDGQANARAQLTKRVVESTRPTGGRSLVAMDPVVIGNCRLNVLSSNKVEVPAQHDGVLWVIGTEIKPGEDVPTDRIITVKIGGEEKKYRELRQGDSVAAQQLLAQLDDRLARDDRGIAQAKIDAGTADRDASEKTREETKQRWDTAERLSRKGSAISEEDRRGARLTYERYYFETISKAEAVKLATQEKNKAQTTLEMHEIHAPIAGTIKSIYRQRGEAVKNLEPVFQLQNEDRLRAEGLVEMQYLPNLQVGMEVVIEPSRPEMPDQTLVGHRMEITGVAVSKNKDNPLFVSSSKDSTVRVWSRTKRFAIRVYSHPTPVRAVACTPPTADANLCLSAGEDGIARLFDLDKDNNQPLRELKGEHLKPINCVAFAPDGKTCATGGVDRTICIWDVASGTLKYRLPSPAHRGEITAVNFTPHSQLVSAGAEGALRVWALSDREAQAIGQPIEGRLGAVSQLGISADGKRALFDKGRELYVLGLPGGETQGILQNPRSQEFSTLALFSPDGQLALTAGASEGRLQLWRLPTDTVRGYEVRQWISPERSQVTCAAISPDGTFGVTGTKDRQLYVWSMPKKEEIDQLLTAKICYIERSVESTARQVKIWADFDNSKIHLIPGTTATMVAYPHK